jgi:sugar/nucleoside kinase (ribokinase family)
MADRFDILGIGCVSVDDLLYVNEFPAADAKVRVNRTARQCGGLTGTALVAASKLGAQCAFGGLLGFDELSLTVESVFTANGIDVLHAIRKDQAQPVHAVIIVAEKDQSRNIFFDASAPVGSDVSGPSEEVIQNSKVLFIDSLGIEGALRATKLARAAGKPVVADFEHGDHPMFGELLGLVDHLVLSESFALLITGEARPELAVLLLWNENRAAVTITCGADGAWFSDDGKQVRHMPAFPVTVVDTTGCGDVFHGAYATALAQGQELEARVRFASAAAALKATQSGGQLGAPTADEVARFLKHRGAV